MRFALLPMVLSGCAALATQPPTPAKYLDVSGLSEPRPCDRYYLLIFSSENTLKQPRFTHTWATAVHVRNLGPNQPPILEQHTISWMPATLDIKPLRTTIEPGINLNLNDSITRVALANGERIEMWGPYECRPRLYTRFLVQKQFMESGQMGYQCVDDIGEAARTGHGCNCIHAITDMDPAHGRRQYPLTRYGFAAGREIVRRLNELDAFIEPARTHDFLIPALGLQSYPILRGNNNELFVATRAPLIGNR